MEYRRCELQPALAAEHSEGGYVNINGPSVIRVPDGVSSPLGRYYLYFAHHKGNHIRMAYAGELTGPWTLYEGGVLSLEDSGFPAAAHQMGPNTALEDLRASFAPAVVRDYLLLSYCSRVTDQEARQRRGQAVLRWLRRAGDWGRPAEPARSGGCLLRALVSR